MTLWDSEFEGAPDNFRPLYVGAEALRDTKEAVKEHLEVDHEALDGSTAGEHSQLTIPIISADPATPSEGGILYAKTLGSRPELFLKNSAGLVTVLTSGGILASPRFNAYMSEDQSVSSLGTHVIQFDTEDYDVYGEFDTSTYTWTPGVTGLYLVTWFIENSGTLQANLTMTRSSTSHTLGTNGMALVRTLTGDTINVVVTAVSSLTVYGGSTHSRFAGSLLYRL